MVDYANAYRFIGYGNKNARLRFIGKEEGFGGKMTEAEIAKNDIARCDWAEIEDLHKAHLTLKEQKKPIDISRPRSGSTLVWLFMSHLALAAEGADPMGIQSEDRIQYLRTKLGRSDGTTLMTEMYPIPAATNCRRRVIGGFAAGEVKAMLKARKEAQDAILKKSPGVTICYGVGKRDDYARHLGVTWKALSDLDRVQVASSDETIFLTPFFGTGQWSYEEASKFAAHKAFQRALEMTA